MGELSEPTIDGVFFKNGLNKLKFCKNLKYQKKITVCIRWRRVGSRRDKSKSGTYKKRELFSKILKH